MKSQLLPLFDTPQFQLVPGSQALKWANVNNQLEVSHKGEDRVVSLDISATLFHLMYSLKISPDSEVTLYLEDDGPKMIFGMIIDGERLIDLWHYTLDRVPLAFR